MSEYGGFGRQVQELATSPGITRLLWGLVWWLKAEDIWCGFMPWGLVLLIFQCFGGFLRACPCPVLLWVITEDPPWKLLPKDTRGSASGSVLPFFQTLNQGTLRSVLLTVGPESIGAILSHMPPLQAASWSWKTTQIPGALSKSSPNLDPVAVWWFGELTRMTQKSAFYFWAGTFCVPFRVLLDAGNSVTDRYVFPLFWEQKISCLCVFCGVSGNQAGPITALCSCDSCNISFQEMAFL